MCVCVHSEQEDAEGVCGGPLDVSGTPETADQLSQGRCGLSGA